ncbi:MAG: P1 family peptidase [Candidatus Wallbacteria bacterium]|nr:P1 family peptidase [Candidatus Wallbacteria bacterium]
MALWTMRAPRGFEIGHWTDCAALTGCTVILCRQGANAAVSVQGGAPATRETDLLRPGMLVQQVHAVVLTGGSAFGLDSACGVVHCLESEGIGFQTPFACVPIVSAAALYDLSIGSAATRPGQSSGEAACRAAHTDHLQEGNAGAGTGATCGKALGFERATKTGLGAASLELPGGGTVAAVAVANCFGEIVYAETGRILAGARGDDGRPVRSEALVLATRQRPPFGNTTLVCVMTDLEMDRKDLTRVADQANDGLARAVRPCHTLFDGDTIFTLASGSCGLRGDPLQVGVAAVEAVVRALVRAATQAESAGGLPAHRDLPAGD